MKNDPDMAAIYELADWQRRHPARWDANKPLQGKPPLVLTACKDITLPAEQEALIADLLYTETVAALIAPPGVGKSTLAVEWSLSVATGIDRRGKKNPQGGVVYVALEGHQGIQKRVLAGLKLRGLSGKDVPFYLANGSLDLVKSTAFAEWLNQQILEIERRTGVPVKLVVIDTVNRALRGDESSSEVMGNFLANVDVIRAGTKPAVLALHHPTKDPNKPGPRGHSSLEGAIETLLILKRMRNGALCLESHKQKDEKLAPKMFFRLAPVDLGPAKDGGRITAAVIEDADDVFEEVEEIKLARGSRQALDILKGFGKPITTDDWRDAYWEANPGKTSQARSIAFKRACKELKDAKLVEVRSGKNHPVEGE